MRRSHYQIQCPRCNTTLTERDGVFDCECGYRARLEVPTDTRREIARCIREQRRCAQYLRDHRFAGPPGESAIDGGTAGAWAGLCDWSMEEAILRLEITSGV